MRHNYDVQTPKEPLKKLLTAHRSFFKNLKKQIQKNYKYELSKEKGSNDPKEGVFITSPTAPIKRTGNAFF